MKPSNSDYARVPAAEYKLLVLQSAALAALRTLDTEGKQVAAAHQSKRRKVAALLDRIFVAQADPDQMVLWSDEVEVSPDVKKILGLPLS